MSTDAAPTPATLDPPERAHGCAGPPPGEDVPELRWSRFDGTDVVVKAAGGSSRPRLRREAEVLRRLGELRVAKLVECVEAADHTELVTERFGVLTLADAALMDLPERRAALMSLCSALDGLHEAGWAHADLSPQHVLVGPRGQVRLCSLGSAVELGVRGSEARLEDLADLTTLVLDVLSLEAAFGGPLQRMRWHRDARRVCRRLSSSRGMLEPGKVSEVLVAELAPPRPHRVRLPIAATAVGSLIFMTGVVLLAVTGTTGESPARIHHGDRATSTTGAPGTHPGPGGSSATAASVDPQSQSVPQQAPTQVPQQAPVDAGVTGAADSNTLTAEGVRYRVGELGDVTAVGDWNCDGVATVAVLRPSTGELFAFDSWASTEAVAVARPLGRAPGAVGISSGERCGAPRVEWPDGSVGPIQEGPVEPRPGEETP